MSAIGEQDLKKEYFKHDYKGADWYFFKTETIDYGMGAKECIYKQETLSEKKHKFEEFCKSYEEE